MINVGVDTYSSLTDLKALLTHHGRDFSAYDNEAIEVAARKAALWLDGEYGARYPGKPTQGRAQALGWPRVGVVDPQGYAVATDEIPAEMKIAQAEAAWRILTGADLAPDQDNGRVVTERTVGPISTKYAEPTGPRKVRVQAIDGILSRLFVVAKPTATFKGF